MTNSNQKPAAKFRDGNLTATLWKNASEKGTFYSTEFERSYKDGEDYKVSRSFSGNELLRVARLANKAYDKEQDLRTADKI